MKPVAQVARALLPNVPNFSALRIPRGAPGSERLVNAAFAMADAAQEHVPVFLDAGQQPDFLDRLRAAAAAVRESVLVRSESKTKRVGATKGVKEEIRRARRAVTLLDAVVTPALLAHPSWLAEWNVTKRVGRTAGGASDGRAGEAVVVAPSSPGGGDEVMPQAA